MCASLAVALHAAAATAAVPPVAARPPPASALASRRVLLIVERPRDAFAERIRSEVAALGLPVVVLEPWRTHEAVGPLETMARAQHAVAAIRMLPSRQGVEVWMADETSGRSLLRQLVVDESPGGPDQGLIALQTAELMRTSLLSRPRTAGAADADDPTSAGPGRAGSDAATGLRAAAGGTASTSSPSLSSSSASPPSPNTLGVDASLGAMFSPSSGGPALQAWLSVHRSLGARLDVALDLSGPLRSSTLSGPEGSARVGAYLAGAGLLWHATSPTGRFFGSGGGGVAIVRVSADGAATAPLAARPISAVTGAGYLRADAGVALSGAVRVGVRAVLGATTGRVALRFAGNDAGVWGRPFLASLAVVDLSWR